MSDLTGKDGEAAPPIRADAPPEQWLNRNVLGMGLTSLLSDACYEMATAVLPGFLTALGAPVYSLGLIEGTADAVSSFVKLGSGWYGDKLGHRKAIVTAGYALTGSACALFAVALSWPMVLAGKVAAWFGKGIRGPLRNAMLAESVPARDRGKAFGFHRAGDTVGAVVGPLAGAALLQFLQPHIKGDATTPFRTIFLLTLIPGLGSALAFGFMVREHQRGVQPRMRFWASVRSLPVGFRRFLVGVGVFGVGDFSAALLILAATQLLEPAYGIFKAAQIAAYLYAWRNVVYAAVSYPAGSLSDRIGRRGLLVLGYGTGALMAGGFAVIFALSLGNILLLAVLVSLSGVSIAVEDALEGAMAADLVPETSVRGIAYGVLGTVNGVGDFLSSAIVGVLWLVSPVLGFSYAGTAMLLGAMLMYRVK